jgi:quinohemoprotein ethanol dehydrogenase
MTLTDLVGEHVHERVCGMFFTRRAATAVLAIVMVVSGAVVPIATRAQSPVDIAMDAQLAAPVTNNWGEVGGNLTNQRYSSLDQIATWNVANLKPVFKTSLVSGPGSAKYWGKYNQEDTPVEQDGVLYMTTGNDDVFALNAVTGAKLWTYHSTIDQKNNTVCCQWNDRGIALGQGLVFNPLLDGGIVALSQKTGAVVWTDHLVRWQDGGGVTAAPLYYNGSVFIGTVGGEYGARGRLYALDAATGKEQWRFYTTAAPGTVGGNTWPNNGAYLRGGATIWNTPAVDPQLGLLYFSTGNAGPDFYGGNRPGANLFSSSIIALSMKTGKLAWYFQEVHHDIWDFDAPSPVVLFNTVINGQMRQGIGQVGKTAFVYELDRATGKPLIGINEKPVPQNKVQKTYPTQPYPVGDAVSAQCAQKVKGFHSACIFDPVTSIDTVFEPIYNGGVDESPMAFSPQTGYLYTGADNQPGDLTYANQPYKKGQFYAGFGSTNTLVGAVNSGTFTAINAATNKIAWQIPLRDENGSGSGAMATAGGLVFNAQIDGALKAYDAKTGKVLWQFQTGLPNNAPMMTYDVNGVQYLAIDAGGHGYLSGAQAAADTLWVFSLKGPTNGVAIPQPSGPAPIDNVTKLAAGAPVHTGKIAIFDYGYKPFGAAAGFGSLTFTVSAGTTVTWVNTGTQPHTSTSITGGWDTGIISPGGSATTVMKKVGTFTFTCTPHPWMIGQVIVTPI